jgi:integrase/recombinase XerC
MTDLQKLTFSVDNGGIDINILVEAFLSGKKKTTIDAYRQDLECFRKFRKMDSIDMAAEFLLANGPASANLTAMTYKTWLIENHMSANTVNRRLASLRSLVKLGRALGLVVWDMTIQNQRVTAYRDTSGPGEENLAKMLELASRCKNPIKACRDTAILRLLHDLALRRGELVSLDLSDVEFEKSRIAVIGKGKDEKEFLSLPIETTLVLKKWIDTRGDDSGALFTSLDRRTTGLVRRITGRAIHLIVKKLGKEIGINTRPHGIRHTAITQALITAQENGIPLEEVMQFSRHKDLSTIMVYRDREANVQGKIAGLVSGQLK